QRSERVDRGGPDIRGLVGEHSDKRVNSAMIRQFRQSLDRVSSVLDGLALQPLNLIVKASRFLAGLLVVHWRDPGLVGGVARLITSAMPSHRFCRERRENRQQHKTLYRDLFHDGNTPDAHGPAARGGIEISIPTGFPNPGPTADFAPGNYRSAL